MRKITWDDLTIELLGVCQLKCQHCFRGQKQNIDISKETIDHLLDQTEVYWQACVYRRRSLH